MYWIFDLWHILCMICGIWFVVYLIFYLWNIWYLICNIFDIWSAAYLIFDLRCQKFPANTPEASQHLASNTTIEFGFVFVFYVYLYLYFKVYLYFCFVFANILEANNFSGGKIVIFGRGEHFRKLAHFAQNLISAAEESIIKVILENIARC